MREPVPDYCGATYAWLMQERVRLLAIKFADTCLDKTFTREHELELTCVGLALDMRHLERSECTIADAHLGERVRTITQLRDALTNSISVNDATGHVRRADDVEGDLVRIALTRYDNVTRGVSAVRAAVSIARRTDTASHYHEETHEPTH
jgi:hypothetical protein